MIPVLTAVMLTNEPTKFQKYQPLIVHAETAGVQHLHVREFNNILYIDGHTPSEEVKHELWKLFYTIDEGYRSGDLVLNLTSKQAV